jgi:type VI secretion system protein ImpB
MAKSSSQKFIARNRAPRVQIEYKVEAYGSEKKVQLPFVMGVMSDLSGDSRESLPPLDERKLMEIDVDNFDERLRSIRPTAALTVRNALTGAGDVALELAFESMSDFSPAKVAAQVAPLARLLEARTQLTNLVTYMDGKAGAEELIARVLADPALLQALASAPETPVSPAASSEDGHW